jgi:predicted peptidase
MTLYENKGHLIWNETYDNPAVIKWLLAQRIS